MAKAASWKKKALLITKAAVSFDSLAKRRGARATAAMMLQFND